MAVEVLGDVPLWSLKASGWKRVGLSLEGMERTLAAGDLTGFRRAVADVEMAGPHRISGLEEASSLPFPEEYRERINELIHSLGPAPVEGLPHGNADSDSAGSHD